MRTFARLVIVALLAVVFASASLAYESDLGLDVAAVEVGTLYEQSFEADLTEGDCWRNGGGSGYPTRMWMIATDAYGSYYVDTAIQEDVDAALTQVMAGEGTDLERVSGVGGDAVTYTLAAFCDGIDLS